MKIAVGQAYRVVKPWCDSVKVGDIFKVLEYSNNIIKWDIRIKGDGFNWTTSLEFDPDLLQFKRCREYNIKMLLAKLDEIQDR